MLRKLCQFIVKTAGKNVNTTSKECQSHCEIEALRSHIESMRDEIQELHKMSTRIQRKVYRGTTQDEEGNHENNGDLSWLKGIR